MFNLRKDILGLAISPEKIFVSRFKIRNGRAELDKTVSAPLVAGTVERGFIMDADGFSRTLKDLLAKNDIKTKAVFACVAGAEVAMRTVARGEADKYPLFDKESIGGAVALGDSETVIFSLKRDMVNSLFTAVKRSALELIGVDTVQLAALRALNQSELDADSKKAVLVVLAGTEKTDISVIKDARPFYTRTIETVSAEELAKEIKITIEFWEDRSSLVPIKKTIVFSDVPGLDAALQQDIIPVFPKIGLSEEASVGLGMRLNKEPSILDVNLLPPEKFRKMKLEKKVIKIFTLFSAAVFAFFALSGVLTMVLRSDEKKLIPIERELGALPDILSKIEALNVERHAFATELDEKKNFFDSLNPVKWADILREIKDNIPPQVWLTEIISSGNSLAMNGKTYSQEAVYDYVRFLEYSEHIYGSKPTVLERGESESEKSIFLFKINSFLAPESEE